MSKIRSLLIAGGIAAAAMGMTVTSAVADPPPGVTPVPVDIVGTGSDTTQFVIGQASGDYDTSHQSAARKWYSWDAVGSATIQEKAGCDPNRIRPNGSAAGIAELEANLHPTGDSKDFCVDYARSSSGRQPTDPASILYIPFAIDAVTWSADTFTGSTHAKLNLTTAQLNAIYSCDANLLNPAFPNAPVTWKELGGTSTDAVVPVIPQSSSGTRKFFLKEIGNPTLGTCVQGQDNSVEENEGTNAIFSNANTAPDIVFPYSVAVFLAQSQGGHGTGTQGKQVLRNVDGTSPTVTNKTTKHKSINVKFPYLRDVYNVVRSVSTTGGQTVPLYLRGIFGNGTANTGWLCRNATARADVRSFGFLPLPSTQCGIAQ